MLISVSEFFKTSAQRIRRRCSIAVSGGRFLCCVNENELSCFCIRHAPICRSLRRFIFPDEMSGIFSSEMIADGIIYKGKDLESDLLVFSSTSL